MNINIEDFYSKLQIYYCFKYRKHLKYTNKWLGDQGSF